MLLPHRQGTLSLQHLTPPAKRGIFLVSTLGGIRLSRLPTRKAFLQALSTTSSQITGSPLFVRRLGLGSQPVTLGPLGVGLEVVCEHASRRRILLANL